MLYVGSSHSKLKAAIFGLSRVRVPLGFSTSPTFNQLILGPLWTFPEKFFKMQSWLSCANRQQNKGQLSHTLGEMTVEKVPTTYSRHEWDYAAPYWTLEAVAQLLIYIAKKRLLRFRVLRGKNQKKVWSLFSSSVYVSFCSPFWQHVVGTGRTAPWEFTSMRVSHYPQKKWVSERGFCCSIPSNISKCPQTTVCAWCSLTLEAPRQRLWVVHSGLCQALRLDTASITNICLDHIGDGLAEVVPDIPSISFSNWTFTVVRRPSSSSSTRSCRPRSSALASWHDHTQPEHTS